jgi:hypothetical protein
MTLRKDLLEGIERFLALLPAQTRQRGRSYHASGNVLEFECVEPDHLYAAVVRGGEDYEVGLEFSESEWASDCSCPMQYDCKHVVAAMPELRQRVTTDPGRSTVASFIQTLKNKALRGIEPPVGGRNSGEHQNDRQGFATKQTVPVVGGRFARFAKLGLFKAVSIFPGHTR